MKIATKIGMVTGFISVFVLGYTGINYFFSLKMQTNAEKYNFAREIGENSFRLAVLRHEYIAYRSERSLDQILAVRDSLNKTLLRGSSYEYTPEEYIHIESIQQISDAWNALTNELILGVESNAKNDLITSLNERLSIKGQERVFHAEKLAVKIQEELDFLLFAYKTCTLIFLFFFMGALSVILFINMKAIRAIRFLQEKFRLISQGDFGYRLPASGTDEIASLSHSFNTLADALQDSKKDLENKVEQKTTDIKSKVVELNNLVESLSRAKIATQNLLEDLTEEKSAVDKKVVQRTKELTESKGKIETLIESMGDGVMAVDINNSIVLWNKTAEIITGWKKVDVIGRQFHEVLKIIHEHDRADGSGFIDQAMKEGSVKSMENHMLLIRKDGTEIPVGDSASAVRDSEGKVTGVIVVFRDTSKERALNKAKDEFVSIASHQLRTPLTAIKGYTGMLIDQIPGTINDKQREYLGEMKHANDRMIELITALLNASRADLDVLVIEPKPLNVENVANETLSELEIGIKDKRIKIQTNFEAGLPMVNADPKIVKMIFQNLLSNAVKYTPNEGNVSLEVKKDDSSFLITVSDSGYGIPEDVKSKIFTKMFRADNARSKDPDGTGLGLYIIKAALEQTGGKIWFDSKENIGSTFYVTIPLAGMKKREGTKSLQ